MRAIKPLVLLALLGCAGAAATPAVARLLLFPFALVYLLLFAAIVHTKRRIRIS